LQQKFTSIPAAGSGSLRASGFAALPEDIFEMLDTLSLRSDGVQA
jgi:hypothetical protein